MTFIPAAMFAATTVLQYKKRSCSTRHAPAEIPSQDAKLSLIARVASASSAASSNAVEYGVALMASILPVKSGWKVQKSCKTVSGDNPSTVSASGLGKCCSQYHSQTCDKSIPLLRLFGRASDGEGGPASAQAKRRALERALPAGWWIIPALGIGLLLWIGVSVAIWLSIAEVL